MEELSQQENTKGAPRCAFSVLLFFLLCCDVLLAQLLLAHLPSCLAAIALRHTQVQTVPPLPHQGSALQAMPGTSASSACRLRCKCGVKQSSHVL